MLKLVEIVKDYKVADTVVKALKGVSFTFRKNEFVSVLGPSGCGKTTMLNIIGGLDKYTSGDLFINGKSTKAFKDKDWDVYRNRKIGFIFQSYNLIPHQTVLANVELALTIAGISKAERAERAKKALDKVGLSDQYKKRPNQLSGGQCQRVAIARALVNDPEILLADEPTGALDTTTSVQIMELIKEIAKERLVIMVTHNPELAEKYSTRIIRLLDGSLQSDSNPVSEKEEKKMEKAITDALEEEKAIAEKAKLEKAPKIKKAKAKMSLWTSFKLSLNNLFSKKSRTTLTSIAGSIGIIGISLVLSFSYGIQTYIGQMQQDMLSGNPVSISRTAFDITSFISEQSESDSLGLVVTNGFVNVNAMVATLAKRASAMDNLLVSNEITQEYIDYLKAMPEEYRSAIFMSYGIDVTNNIYVDFKEEASTLAQNMSLSTLREVYTQILKENEDTKNYASMVTGLTNVFAQAPDNKEYLLTQYNLLEGKVATEKNEVMIVVGNDRSITDLLLAHLGYYTQEEFINMIYDATDNDDYNENLPVKEKYAYDELMEKTFTWYPNDTVYTKNTIPFMGDMTNFINPFTYNAYSKDFTEDNGIELEVVGILEKKSDVNYGSLSAGFYYTEALTNHIIETSLQSEIVKYLNEEAKNDKFTSGRFEITKDSFPDEMAFLFDMGILQEGLQNVGINYTYSYTKLDGTASGNKTGYVGSTNQMVDMMGIFMNMIGGGKDEGDGGFNIPSYYEMSLRQLGGSDIASRVSIYSTDLEQKAKALEYLDRWNEYNGTITVNGYNKDGTLKYTKSMSLADRTEIKYTDSLSLIFGMISTVIDMITIGLIGFTSLALFVSCVMIAIITYVSVMERVKEIGVIRSLGGRKNDVSNLFIAETTMIGAASGAIAIAFTYFASWIINIIVNNLAGITIAIFPLHYALLMAGLSIALTLISGFIPSRSAAKKDPVVALRTEG